MCDYCETAYYKNDSGREFGKLFDMMPALIYQCQLIFAQSADEALIHTINIPQVDPAERYGFRRIGLGD